MSRLLVIFGSLVAMTLATAMVRTDPAAPVTAGGLHDQYCVDVDVIRLKIENASGKDLRMSTSIERLSDTGKWEEFAADVFGTEPFPWKVQVIRLAKDQAKPIRWQPKRTGSPLRDGRYRVVVTVLRQQTSATAHVVGEFLVTKEACPAKGGSSSGRGHSLLSPAGKW